MKFGIYILFNLNLHMKSKNFKKINFFYFFLIFENFPKNLKLAITQKISIFRKKIYLAKSARNLEIYLYTDFQQDLRKFLLRKNFQKLKKNRNIEFFQKFFSNTVSVCQVL